jgi:hypothetical protein
MRHRLAPLVVASGLALVGCGEDEACEFGLVDTSGRSCTGTLCPAFEMACTPPPSPSCVDRHTWALGPPPDRPDMNYLTICAICLAPDGGIGTEGYFDCHDVTCVDNDDCKFPVGYVCSNGRCVLP